MLVVSHQQSPCTWSLPCLYEQNTLRAKCGEVDPPNSISESLEPAIMMHTRCRQLLLLMPEQGGRTSQERWTCQTKIKFKTKTGLTKEGGITIGSATTGAPPQESSSSRVNRSTRSMNFHNYQGQDYEATSRGHPRGRMSFSGRGYHDS